MSKSGGNLLSRRRFVGNVLKFCQKIAIVIFFTYANSAISGDIETGNFTAFNSAVANSSIGTIFLTGDITATANISAQAAATLTIAAKPDGAERTIFGAKKAGFSVYGTKTLTIGDGITFENFYKDGRGSVISAYESGSASKVVIGNNVTFKNCTSTTYGGVLDATDVIIGDNVRFENNSSGLDGAAVQNEGYFTIDINAIFRKNKATRYSGAITNGNLAKSLIVRNNALFEGNTAINGGAISNYNGNSVIENNVLFRNNTASSSGGAMYLGNGSVTLTTSGGIALFTGNKANAIPSDIGLNNRPLTINGAAGSVIFEGGISGSDTIAKDGDGTLVFGPGTVNSFTGTFTQSAGTTRAFGQFPQGTSNINGGVLEAVVGAKTLANIFGSKKPTMATAATFKLSSSNPDSVVDVSAATALTNYVNFNASGSGIIFGSAAPYATPKIRNPDDTLIYLNSDQTTEIVQPYVFVPPDEAANCRPATFKLGCDLAPSGDNTAIAFENSVAVLKPEVEYKTAAYTFRDGAVLDLDASFGVGVNNCKISRFVSAGGLLRFKILDLGNGDFETDTLETTTSSGTIGVAGVRIIDGDDTPDFGGGDKVELAGLKTVLKGALDNELSLSGTKGFCGRVMGELFRSYPQVKISQEVKNLMSKGCEEVIRVARRVGFIDVPPRAPAASAPAPVKAKRPGPRGRRKK